MVFLSTLYQILQVHEGVMSEGSSDPFKEEGGGEDGIVQPLQGLQNSFSLVKANNVCCYRYN